MPLNYNISGPYAAQLQHSITTLQSTQGFRDLENDIAARFGNGFTVNIRAGDTVVTDRVDGQLLAGGTTWQFGSPVIGLNTNVQSYTADANGNPVRRSLESILFHEMGHLTESAQNAHDSAPQGPDARTIAGRRAAGTAEENYVNQRADDLTRTLLNEPSRTADGYKYTQGDSGTPELAISPGDIPVGNTPAGSFSLGVGTRDEPGNPGTNDTVEIFTSRNSDSSTDTFIEQRGAVEELDSRTSASSIDTRFDGSGNIVSESGTNASGATWSEDPVNGTFTYNGQQYRGTQLASSAGLTLGSSIGGILGGNSLTGRIAGATVLGTLGQSVGNILDRSGFTDALLGHGPFTTNLFDSAVSTTVADFGGDLGVNAVGTIAGTFSSLLFGEAAHALGLNGFAAGAFTTVGTSITTQLATNLGAMTLNSLDIPTTLVADFSPGNFVGNAAGAIGGYFGSYLAAEIVPPRGPDAAIGGRIGGAVGSLIASQNPVLGQLGGPAVGGFLGTIVGTLDRGPFDLPY